jgi:hypothetical protein
MRPRFAAGVLFVLAAACGTPTGPTPPPPPPVVGPATPPVIRAITVPTSRVEAGQAIAITATVEDAETPLNQLLYQWSASAGTITGSGTTATWTMPEGITAGVNVTLTLTVVDTYDAVVNNRVVKQQFTVVGTSSTFRVHDSEAELLGLATKFLRDLFGNSSVRPADCLVDFTDLCADLAFGKTAELGDITDHRSLVEVQSVTFFSQIVTFQGADAATVFSDAEFRDRWLSDGIVRPYRNEFVVTGRYHLGRWWICESYVYRANDLARDGWMAADGRGRIGERKKK